MNREYTSDKREGNHLCDILFRLFGHASLSISHLGRHIYVDPCMSENDFKGLPKAALILVTHHHDDHFDPKAVEILRKSDTVIITNAVVGAEVEGAEVLGESNRTFMNSWLAVEAVPAYNVERTQYHPRSRGDNGYIVELAGRRTYIAGDTELTPEMVAVEEIDYLFLPVNLPYTMTVEMAVEAAGAIRPRVFYPFHTIGTSAEEIARIPELLKDEGFEVVVAPME